MVLPIVLSALLLGGFVCAVKGVYCEDNGWLFGGLLFGGTLLSCFAAAGLTWWVMDHLPLD